MGKNINHNSQIEAKNLNGLEIFGLILSHILFYIIQLTFKTEIKNLLKDNNQNFKNEGEN